MTIFQSIPALRTLYRGGFVVIMSLALGAAPSIAWAQAKPGSKENTDCVPVGSWIVPGGGKISGTEGIARAAKRDVVLLGEMHDNAEHHRWQLQTLAALHAARPDMVIGFEMFPRRVQKALDQWVAGELSEAEFLAAADWGGVWSTDANLYLPLFHFARMNRVPMVALNIDARLRKAVAAKGLDGVPENEREGVMPPFAPSDAYLDYLMPFYGQHERGGKKKGEVSRDDPDFRRFVESQQLWDRAMAQAIRSALDRPGRPLVVGIMGSGHIKYGYGVPHQLKDLRVTEVATLLPWNSGTACDRIVTGLADAVFGVAAESPVSPEPPRQRLGIRFEMAQDGGARVLQVGKRSIAEIAGIRDSDVITEAAGTPIKQTDDIVEIVKRQAPGTLLPLKLKRNGETVEIIARFPAVSK
ncbi:MAG: ChaN family lipoprotein [Nitrosospira sp.]|nr:ChaN family lipoprotein [Nitrosospira sp.]